MSENDLESVRLDKWLWAARFFKTRSLATEAINGGKVHVGGQRVKPSRMIKVGEKMTVRQGRFEKVITVLGISAKRGPASVAQQLYEESAESVQLRETIVQQEKLMRQQHGTRKPEKHSRRKLRQLKHQQ